MQVPINSIIVEERFRKDFGPIEDLAASIAENGLITPIAVETMPGGTYRLLAGERRLRACKALGLETIAIRVYDEGLSELRQRQIELEENIQRKDMTWLEECTLKREIHNMRLAIHGAKVSTAPNAPGWSMRDTAKLLDETPANLSLDLNLAKAVEQFPEIDWENYKNKNEARKQVTKLTKTLGRQVAAAEFEQKLAVPGGTKSNTTVLIERMAASYLIGDCVEMMKKLPSAFADFIEIDPPYAIDLNDIKRGGTDGYDHYNEIDKARYMDFMRQVIAESWRVAKPNAWLVLWFGPEPWFEPLFKLLTDVGFATKRLPGIWTKPNGQTQQPLTNLANSYEMFFYARKGAAELHLPGRSNIFDYPPVVAGNKRHPTERPTALIQELLNVFTIENAQVVVPFAGSGRTMIEAWKMKRSAVGYDLSDDYRNGYLEAIAQEIM